MDHDGYVAFIESCNQPDVSKVGGVAMRRCGQSRMSRQHINVFGITAHCCQSWRASAGHNARF